MKLNANVQDKQNEARGQGSGNSGLYPRTLKADKAKDPNVASPHKQESYGLYAPLLSPSNVQLSRVVALIPISEDKSVPASSQLNNKINPAMNNMSVKGGVRNSW